MKKAGRKRSIRDVGFSENKCTCIMNKGEIEEAIMLSNTLIFVEIARNVFSH